MKRIQLSPPKAASPSWDQSNVNVDALETTQDDAHLLQAIAQQRDSNALATLFQRHQRAAYNLALRITLKPEIAEEALQDAMLVVWQSASSYRQTGKVRSWLLRIVALRAMRCSRDRRRERKRIAVRKELEPDIRNTASEGSLEQSESIKALKYAYKILEEPERQLLTLHFGGGLTKAEIAKALALSSRTVSYRIQVTLEKLRNQLVKAGLAASALNADLLCDAICSGSEPPMDLTMKISHMAEQIPEQAGAAGSSVGLVWKLAGVLSLAGLATVFAVSQQRSGPNEAVKPTSSGVQVEAPKGKVIAPVHKIWDFEKGPSNDLKVIDGKWTWKPAIKNTPAGMHTFSDYPVGLVPDVLVPPQPLKVKFVIQDPDPEAHSDKVMGALWELKGRLHEELRVWRNRTFEIRKGVNFVFYSYLFDNYMVGIHENGDVYSIIEHEFAYPDQRVFLMAKNWLVSRIEMHTIEYDQIPSEIRNTPTLIKNLMAQEKLKLDPPKLWKFKNQQRKKTPLQGARKSNP